MAVVVQSGRRACVHATPMTTSSSGTVSPRPRSARATSPARLHVCRVTSTKRRPVSSRSASASLSVRAPAMSSASTGPQTRASPLARASPGARPQGHDPADSPPRSTCRRARSRLAVVAQLLGEILRVDRPLQGEHATDRVTLEVPTNRRFHRLSLRGARVSRQQSFHEHVVQIQSGSHYGIEYGTELCRDRDDSRGGACYVVSSSSKACAFAAETTLPLRS